jgi:hypothetical protein
MNLNRHWRTFKMSMNRKLIKKINMGEEADDGLVQAEKNELISMIWEITKDNWSFVRGQDVKRRLQRDVATIVRRTS